MKMTLIFLSLSVIGASISQAQSGGTVRSNNIPREFYPPGLRPPVRLTPEEQVTIARAQEDLKSENPEFRTGAVMILGKYEADVARNEVIRMLKDPSERVRRAALVSVVEWSRTAPASCVEPVLSLLSDKDTEIRRMASSSIQNMMLLRSMGRMSAFGSRPQQPFPKSVQEGIINAFLDSDVVVRRNMIRQYSMTGFQVPDATFIQLLQDTDRQVRLAALPLASRKLDRDVFLDAVQHLVNDPERTVRLRLIRELLVFSSQAARAMLASLSNDQDEEVASEAMIWLFQFSKDNKDYEQLYKRHLSGALTQAQSARLIQLSPLLGKQSIPYIMQFLEVDNATLRLEAVRAFLGLRPDNTHAATFLKFMNDRSGSIRLEVLNYIQFSPDLMTPELTEEILYSDYEDVRNSLLNVLDNFKAEQQEELLFELLLDEDIDIRKKTLNQITARKMPGWAKILKASLKDPNTEIQKTAARLLFEVNTPESAQVINDFLKRNPDSLLSDFIKKMKTGGRFYKSL